MCVGHTLGEEILLGQNSQRTESVQSKDHSCVLQVSVKLLAHLKKQRQVGGGGTSLFEDYATLLVILEGHFVQKNEWRF